MRPLRRSPGDGDAGRRLCPAGVGGSPAGDARRDTADRTGHRNPRQPGALQTPAGPALPAELFSGDYAEGRRLLDMAETSVRRPAPWQQSALLAASLGNVLVYCEEHERGRRLLVDCVDSAGREGLRSFAAARVGGHEPTPTSGLGRWAPAYAAAAQSAALADDTGGDPLNGLTQLAYVEAATGRADGVPPPWRARAGDRRRAGDRIDLHPGRQRARPARGRPRALRGGHRAAGADRALLRRARASELPGLAPLGRRTSPRPMCASATPLRRRACSRRSSSTRPGATPSLAHAAVARCRGLMDGDVFLDAHFVRALVAPRSARRALRGAPSELCFGERLRRGGRRTEAREHLRRALATFDALGAQPWSEHASRELHATGERARRRAPDTAAQFTPQELQVALLVAAGATNKEAAAALFVSPKTIEAHLLRVYRKLGLHSRSELARRMLTPDTAAGREVQSSPPATPASSAPHS